MTDIDAAVVLHTLREPQFSSKNAGMTGTFHFVPCSVDDHGVLSVSPFLNDQVFTNGLFPTLGVIFSWCQNFQEFWFFSKMGTVLSCIEEHHLHTDYQRGSRVCSEAHDVHMTEYKKRQAVLIEIGPFSSSVKLLVYYPVFR